jgi:hypothetical protein
LKNIAELTQVLAQYFFVVESKENLEVKITKLVNGEQKEKVRIKETSKSLLLVGKRYNIQATILSKQKIPLEHLWKIFYCDQQRQQKGCFLLNDYQKRRALSQLEIGAERNILLVNGWKHRFLSKIF